MAPSTSFSSTPTAPSKSQQKISDTQGGFGGVLDNVDYFGRAWPGIGDLDGDGAEDIAVGAFRDDDDGADRGAVYVLFLNTNGTVKGEQKISSDTGGLTGPLDDLDRFGTSVSGVGDVDSDGVVDIAVGAFRDDDGGADRGAVYVLFLNTNGTVKGEQKISSDTGGLTGPLVNSDEFGASVTGLGDLDGDGIIDIAVGAFRDDDGGADRGAVYVLNLAAPNGAPTADAGGPYGIAEGDDDLVLDGSGSSDPETDPLTYKWDLNNDLTYGDVTGVNPTVSWATLQSFGIDDDGGPFTIGLEVDDGNGNTASDTAQLTVTNTPPTISVTGTGTANPGVAYTVNLSVSDYGDDTVTQWIINWGDGNIETIAGNPATANHTFAQARPYNIVASVTDEDSLLNLPWHQDRMIVPGLFAAQQLFRLEATSGNVYDNIGAGTGLGWAIATTIGPDGLGYVGSYTTDRIYQFDPLAASPTLTEWVSFQSGGLDGPAGMEFGPNGNLFVSSNFGDEVLEYDASDGSFVGAFVPLAANGPLDEPDDLAFGPDGNLYVTSFNTDQVLQYNGTNGSFIKVFASGIEMDQPSELVFAKHDAGPWYLYVTSVANDHVARYNGTSGVHIDNFAVRGATGLNQPRGAVFGPDGHLYVGGQNQVIRYNGWTGALIDTYVASGSISGPSQSAFVPSHRVVVSNGPPVFDQDLLDRVDAEASWISLSAGATDPESDTLVYSATGLPLGLSIDSGSGLITGLVNYYAAAASPYAVEITVDDGNGGTDTDTFSWTISNVPTTDPYVVANLGGANGGDDLLTEIDPLDFDPVTNEVDIGTGTGTTNLLGLAIEPLTGIVYAADGDRLGTLNVDSGVFTAVGGTFGSGDGKQGTVTLDDVRGLAFHPLTGELVAVHHQAADRDLLFPVDPNTGSIIPGTFNAGRDYAELKSALLEVTDIAIDPTDWETYGIFTDGVGNFELQSINRWNGATNSVGPVTAQMRGLSFDPTGLMWGTDSGTLYEIDKTTGATSNPRTLSNGSDYQAVALAVPPYYPPSVEGTIFEDVDGNAVPVGEFVGDFLNPGLAGATIRMYNDDGSVPGEPDALDTLYASKTAGPTGHYYFTSVPDGVYWMTIDSASLVPDAGGSGWAEQTYGPVEAVTFDGSYSFAATAGPLYGGMQPTVSDNAALLPSSEHVVRIDLSPGEEIEQVDLGFSFNVVTNLSGGDATSPQGSLRQFITNATNGTGPNPMRFVPVVSTNATDGTNNWWSLALTADLPSVAGDGTVIDGAAYDNTDGVTVLAPNPGTLGAGGNVGVDGLGLSAVDAPELEIVASGLVGPKLTVAAGSVTIRRLAMNGSMNDIVIQVGANDAVIENNVLGADARFIDPGAGFRSEMGVFGEGGDTATVRENLVGYHNLAGIRPTSDSLTWLIENNEIRSNSLTSDDHAGIWVQSGGATVRGNLVIDHRGVGVIAADGAVVVNNTVTANGQGGVSTFGVKMGGLVANTVDRNVIFANVGAGVAVEWDSLVNHITRNSIYANGTIVDMFANPATGQIGIDLLDKFDDGGAGTSPFFTINDDGDGDTDGGNDFLNYPVIETAVIVGADLVLTGFSPAGAAIEFFIADPDPSGFGEGKTWLITKTEGAGDDTGTTTGGYGPGAVNGIVQGEETTTQRFGFAVPLASLAAAISTGEQLTATATVGASTSEFSGQATIAGGVLFVNSTGEAADALPGNGICDTGGTNSEGDPECTLWAAIEESNAAPAADTINFAIPTSDPAHSAGVWTIVPTTSVPSMDTPITIDATTQSGWSALPVIVLDGSSLVGVLPGIRINSSDVVVRGLAVGNFPADGISVAGDDVTIAAMNVGVGADGSTDLGNGTGGIVVTTGDRLTIGGSDPLDRNIVGNHPAPAISIDDSTDSVIRGNYIGVQVDGETPAPNSEGIHVSNSANLEIGGSGADDGNVISGNTLDGITLDTLTSGARVRGNLIGVGADGSTPVGNGWIGVNSMTGSTAAAIGGRNPGEANTIANNGSAGVRVLLSAQLPQIVGNRIHDNVGLGIDVGTGGVNPPDLGDVDGHPNQPALLTARSSGGSTTVDLAFDTAAGDYLIDFYSNPGGGDPSGYGEGEQLLATVSVTHDGSGPKLLRYLLPGAGLTITATATSVTSLETSEFSNAIDGVAAASTLVSDSSIRRSDLYSAQGTPTVVPGVTGGAHDLDGVGDHLVGPSLDVTDSALTISAWVRLDTATGQHSLISKRDGSGDVVYELGIDGGTNEAVATIRLSGAPVTVRGGVVSTAVWQQLTASWDGAELVVYVDGAEVDRTAAVGTLATDATTRVTIGARDDGTQRLDGRVDHVSVGHDPLTSAEVAVQNVNVGAPAVLVILGDEQTGVPGAWTATTDQSRSGSYSLAAPETAGPATAAWAVATGIDEPGLVFESWWWMTTATGVDFAAGTRAGPAPVDQYSAAGVGSPFAWELRHPTVAGDVVDANVSGTGTTGAWIKVEMWTDQLGDSRLIVDGVEVIGWTAQGAGLTSGSAALLVNSLPNGEQWHIDDPRARKLVTPEPVASLGPLDRG